MKKYGVPRDIYAKVKIIGLSWLILCFRRRFWGCCSFNRNKDFSYKPMATINSLHTINTADVSLSGFANQWWEEGIGKACFSFF